VSDSPRARRAREAAATSQSGPGRRALPPLYLISDAARIGEDAFLERFGEAVRGGLSMVLLREPAWGPESISRLAGRVQARLRESSNISVRVLLSRRAELAAELALDGVHLAGGDPSAVSSARRRLGATRTIGYSAHSIEEACKAAAEGADYVSYSPVFGSISKGRHPLPAVGLEGVAEASRVVAVPVYALGGILPEHAGALRKRGAAGAAMIGGILDAADPAAAVRAFLSSWDAAAPEQEAAAP